MLPACDLSLLPGEWFHVHGTDMGAELEQELRRELPAGHALENVVVEAVAVRRHLKDVVYWLPERAEWASVHLTRAVETDVRWPSTHIAADWGRLVDELTATQGVSTGSALLGALMGPVAGYAVLFLPDSDGYDGWLFSTLTVFGVLVAVLGLAAVMVPQRRLLLGFALGFGGFYFALFAFLAAIGGGAVS